MRAKTLIITETVIHLRPRTVILFSVQLVKHKDKIMYKAFQLDLSVTSLRNFSETYIQAGFCTLI